MKVTLTYLYSGRKVEYKGSPSEVHEQLLVEFPEILNQPIWMVPGEPYSPGDWVAADVEILNRQQAFHAEVEQ